MNNSSNLCLENSSFSELVTLVRRIHRNKNLSQSGFLKMKKLRRDKIFSQYLKTENYSKTMQLDVLDFSAEQNHALIQFSLFGSLYQKKVQSWRILVFQRSLK